MRFLGFLALAVWFALHRRPSGGSTTRPHGDGGDGNGHTHGGDGNNGRPSQVHGNINASEGVSSAQTAIAETARRGRPRTVGTSNGQGTTGSGTTDTATTDTGTTTGGDGTSGTTTDGDGTSGTGSSRPEWLDNVTEGNEFNRRREPYYEEQGGANEVHVEPRTDRGQYRRVDSYVPNEEIVSRKHTQLAEIEESTAIGYLREFVNHYDRGTIIADTPTNRRDLGDDLIGQPLVGDLVLEVPVQNGEVPRAVLEEAERLDIIIRDENGTIYELPDE